MASSGASLLVGPPWRTRGIPNSELLLPMPPMPMGWLSFETSGPGTE